MNVLRLTDFPTNDAVLKHSDEIDKYGLGLTHILPLSVELINAGHKVNVLAGGGMRHPRYEIISGINVYRTKLPMKLYYLSMGAAFFLNIRRIEKEQGKVDIVHSHNPRFTYGYCFLKRAAKVPFVATIHGTFKYDSLEKNFFLKLMVSRVDHFIAINSLSFDILKQFGLDNDRISLIPTGVDLDKFKLSGRKDKIVLYSGRLVEWKNVRIVIDVAERLSKTHPDVMFHIVGRGPLEQNLRKSVSEKMLNNVIFFNSVRFEDMPKYYSQASVLLSPHRYDSFGKTVIEALACETPVVGTDFDVPVDVKQCGVFFKDPDDVDGMAEAVMMLIDDEKKRMRLGRAGRVVVEKNYSWIKCAERNIDVYESLF